MPASGSAGRLRRARAWGLTRVFRIRRWLNDARLDYGDWRTGTRDPLLPPRRKGLPSQAAAVGERLVERMQERGGLTPSSAVLDMGCGPGRVAAPLTRFLDPASGTYEGFDVTPGSIKWCRKTITPRHPAFHFQIADIHNGQYNPAGRQRADEYEFPYGNDRFDVALAASLFTHLRPFEGQRYLEEAGRVLKPGGRLLGTWFLINDEAEDLLEREMAVRPGAHKTERPRLKLNNSFTDVRGNQFRSPEAETPEHMIAIAEEAVVAQHEQAGLEVVEIIYGSWPGRGPRNQWPGQDTIVARVPAD